MIDKTSYTYIIIHFTKTFVTNLCMYYSFNIITSKEEKINKIKIFLPFNLLLSILYTYSELKINTIFSLLIMYLLFAIFLGTITKHKTGYSLVITIVSYAISNIALLFSVLANFIPYNIIYKGNYYLNSISVILLQFTLIYGFFKIRRFKNALTFLNKKLNNDITDIVVSFISIVVMLMAAFTGTLYDEQKASIYNVMVIFILLGLTMFIMIQRTLTMHYKQTQLLKTLEEYKNEIAEKDKEIEKLSNEKFNTSKIRHEFYNRQKALELLVKENITAKNSDLKENTSKNILDIIKSLTDEYSEECKKIKQLSSLDKTDITEIDSMFKYMQTECAKNNIEFKLKILGNIHPLINNIIPKGRLETLIGDHLKDAINAVNNESVENKEILVILGMKDDKYELSIHDTGIEFQIDTLLKLGKEKVTTCANKGGSGIGFLTTFETMEQTKASLIITENEPSNDRYYTKSVTIRFDGKHEYIIRSYRAKEIKKYNNIKNIIIENIK